MDELRAVLDEMPREMWRYRPAPGQWSVHEILVHLADSEANSYLRCRLLAAEPGRPVMAYDQDRWAEQLDYHRRSLDDAMAVLSAVRRSTLNFIRDLPEPVWSHSVVHEEYDRPYTFTDWLEVYTDHIPQHVAQIRANHAAWLEAGRPAVAP